MSDLPNRTLVQSKQGEAVFVGLVPELAALASALEDASAGRGQVVKLSGTTGIGKTRPSALAIRQKLL